MRRILMFYWLFVKCCFKVYSLIFYVVKIKLFLFFSLVAEIALFFTAGIVVSAFGKWKPARISTVFFLLIIYEGRISLKFILFAILFISI